MCGFALCMFLRWNPPDRAELLMYDISWHNIHSLSSFSCIWNLTLHFWIQVVVAVLLDKFFQVFELLTCVLASHGIWVIKVQDLASDLVSSQLCPTKHDNQPQLLPWTNYMLNLMLLLFWWNECVSLQASKKLDEENLEKTFDEVKYWKLTLSSQQCFDCVCLCKLATRASIFWHKISVHFVNRIAS